MNPEHAVPSRRNESAHQRLHAVTRGASCSAVGEGRGHTPLWQRCVAQEESRPHPQPFRSHVLRHYPVAPESGVSPVPRQPPHSRTLRVVRESAANALQSCNAVGHPTLFFGVRLRTAALHPVRNWFGSTSCCRARTKPCSGFKLDAMALHGKFQAYGNRSARRSAKNQSPPPGHHGSCPGAGAFPLPQ